MFSNIQISNQSITLFKYFIKILTVLKWPSREITNKTASTYKTIYFCDDIGIVSAKPLN